MRHKDEIAQIQLTRREEQTPSGKVAHSVDYDLYAEHNWLSGPLVDADKGVLENYLGQILTDRQYYLLKEGGLTAALFFSATGGNAPSMKIKGRHFSETCRQLRVNESLLLALEQCERTTLEFFTHADEEDGWLSLKSIR